MKVSASATSDTVVMQAGTTATVIEPETKAEARGAQLGNPVGPSGDFDGDGIPDLHLRAVGYRDPSTDDRLTATYLISGANFR